MNIYQIFLPTATLLFLLLVFILRSVIVWKQTGINPFVFGKSDNAHDYIGLVYKLMTLQMSKSWRIRIDYEEKTELVQIPAKLTKVFRFLLTTLSIN